MNSEVRELGSKSVIALTGMIFGDFILFIAAIIIGRLLGAEIYGQFTYITSFIMLFVVIPQLGMEKGIISFLSRNTLSIEEKRSILFFSLIVSVVIGLIILSIGYLNVNFICQRLLGELEYRELFIVLLPIIILEPIKALLYGSLRAKRRIKEITLLENLVNPISKIILVIILVLIFNMKNYYSLVIPLYINSLAAITYYIVKLKRLNILGKVIRKFNNKQIITFSLPLLFSGIVVIIMHNIDKYMIGFLLDAASVGIYRMVIQFGKISIIALASVNLIFAPLISSLYYDNRLSDLRKLYKLTTKWITIINLMIFGIILVFSKDILHVAGEEFMVGGNALILVSLGQVINSVVGSVGYINIMTGNPKYVLFSNSIALIVNVVLNLALITNYGINGAAIATSIALLIQNVVNFIFMYKNLKMHPYDISYLKLIGISVFSISIIFLLSNFLQIHYLIKLIICGAIYSGIFLFLIYKFVMSKYELKILKSELKKYLKKNRTNNFL
jgi:O-antigen/teichoic acid export membrane protein